VDFQILHSFPIKIPPQIVQIGSLDHFTKLDPGLTFISVDVLRDSKKLSDMMFQTMVFRKLKKGERIIIDPLRAKACPVSLRHHIHVNCFMYDALQYGMTSLPKRCSKYSAPPLGRAELAHMKQLLYAFETDRSQTYSCPQPCLPFFSAAALEPTEQ